MFFCFFVFVKAYSKNSIENLRGQWKIAKMSYYYLQHNEYYIFFTSDNFAFVDILTSLFLLRNNNFTRDLSV